MPRSAFTLIELLLVVTIIAILASLILVGTGMISRTSKKARAEAILGGIRMALGQADSSTGSSISPVEHPLAGSAAPVEFPSAGANTPRALFVRQADGSPVATQGEALVVGDMDSLASDRQRVLRPDDRYQGHAADGDVPLLYGLQRRQIGILGASCDWISGYRRLPPPESGYDDPATGKLQTPYDATVYPDTLFLYRTALPPRTLLDDAVRSAVGYSLAAKMEDLQALGAIRTAAAPDASSAWIAGYRDRTRPVAGAWDAAHRIWLPPADSSDPIPTDKHSPGTLRIDGSWRRYRLRGTGLYDPWGGEILYHLGEGHSVHLVSAGEDGATRFHPGADGVYQTLPGDDLPRGDDRDARSDNVAFFGDE